MNFITKYIKHISCVVFFFIAAAVYFFEYTGNTPYETTVFAFDTYIKFEIYGKNSKEAVQAGKTFIYDMENEMSAYKENSVIYKYNHAAAGDKIKCSPEVLELIEKSIYINEITDGAFDITIYPLCELWDIKNASVPPADSDIRSTLEKIGCENIETDGEYLIKHEGTMLDLGGIAKGYLSDKLRVIMKNHGIKRGIINLGGNVTVIGEKGKNKAWHIGIADPKETNEAITSVSVSDTNVITSGAYQRYFEYNGKIYHHILSPYTGYPSFGNLDSVTVCGSDGALCDGIATAAFILGREKGERLLKKLDLSGIFVTTDGEIVRIGQ